MVALSIRLSTTSSFRTPKARKTLVSCLASRLIAVTPADMTTPSSSSP